jgi:hypothetical protein
MPIKPLFLFFLLAALPACGQTADDLAERYPAVMAYEVRPGVLMIPRYADDGQVCEMTLEKRFSLTPKEEAYTSSFSAGLLKGLLDELVPPAERGEEARRLLPGSFVAGGVFHDEREFDNVIVVENGTVSDGIEMVTIRWKQRTCAPESPPQSTAKSGAKAK